MTPTWMEIAGAEIGQHEVPGAGTNSRIVEYHSATWLKATSDEVPWCSSFVNWALLKAGVEKVTRSPAAASWLEWGEEIAPRSGAITVIRKKKATEGGFHVAFYVSQTPAHITLLGGNQADSVKFSDFPLGEYVVVGYRWPPE